MDRLDQLLAQLAPEIAQAFRQAIQTIVDDAVLKDLIRFLEAGDVDGAFRVLNIDRPVYNRLLDALRSAFQRGGEVALMLIPRRIPTSDGVTAVARFDIRDKRAEEWLGHQSSTLVTRITADARTAVQNALRVGMEQGDNPRATALNIVGRIDPQTGRRTGGTIGLGDREQEWARRARLHLTTLNPAYLDMALRDKRFDRTVRAAIESGKPLPASTVDKLTDRFRDNALKYRGDQIARTETLSALNYSEWLSMTQAVERSVIPESAVTKEWIARHDGHTRYSHVTLDGQIVGINEAFVSPVTGAKMMHPGDASLGAGAEDLVGCRCRVRYKVPFGIRSGLEMQNGQ